jgi:hypothetical protein
MARWRLHIRVLLFTKLPGPSIWAWINCVQEFLIVEFVVTWQIANVVIPLQLLFMHVPIVCVSLTLFAQIPEPLAEIRIFLVWYASTFPVQAARTDSNCAIFKRAVVTIVA